MRKRKASPMILRLAAMLAASLWVTAAVFAQAAGAKPFPVEGASGLQDRTSIDAQGPELVQVLAKMSDVSSEDLREAAIRHATERLATLTTSSGGSQQTFSAYDDLVRFPQPNRGQPVRLAATVREVQKITFSGIDVQFVVASPVEKAGGRVALLVPAEASVPPAGTRVELDAIFAKLIELPESAGAATGIAPLLVSAAAPQAVRAGGALERADWSVVRHRSLGVRPEERSLYYRVLRNAADADPQSLLAAARAQLEQRKQEAPARIRRQQPFPTFVDLFKHPDAYEGKPVTLKGHAREIRKYPAGDNAEGLDTLYEAWVYTEDSESNPAVIVASSASADLPIGSDLQVPVEATGYFFKIYAYHARDTARVAPMVLARRIEKLPEPESSGPPSWLLAAAGAIVALLFGWVLMSYVGTRRRRSTAFAQSRPDLTQILSDE